MNALKVKWKPVGRWWERLGKAKAGCIGNTHTGEANEGEYCLQQVGFYVVGK
jgi:hypothetical protein